MTCAKKRVVAVIADAEGKILGVGENTCNEPQEVCPRLPGEGYHKCKTVCLQPFHAEMDAIAKAAFAGHDIRGASCTILGIDRVCEDCEWTLKAAGITDIRFA